jgi:predicted RNA-binding protein YlxR (DUF448 family)
VRVVRTAEGTLAVGSTLSGRGAWLCGGTGDCLALALKRRALGRALRANVGAAALQELRDRFPAVTPPARD